MKGILFEKGRWFKVRRAVHADTITRVTIVEFDILRLGVRFVTLEKRENDVCLRDISVEARKWIEAKNRGASLDGCASEFAKRITAKVRSWQQ